MIVSKVDGGRLGIVKCNCRDHQRNSSLKEEPVTLVPLPQSKQREEAVNQTNVCKL